MVVLNLYSSIWFYILILTSKNMSSKGKRNLYTDSDCHTLVDLVFKFKDIVESKKTDAVTWRQKVSTWETIAELYKASSIEPRTAQQLRCKFDNLKKEVREYESQRRQSLIRTGGGTQEIEIKAILKLLYEKIIGIIGLSVKGLEASEGDSDVILDVGMGKVVPESFNELKSIKNIEIEFINDAACNTSQVIEVADVLKQQQSPIGQKLECVEKTDWSDFTPSSLKSKKHKVLKITNKRKVGDMEAEDNDIKKENLLLKNKLMEEEAKRNKEYQEKRILREEEMHKEKLRNLVLMNRKLELEIELLKKQLSK